jgi:hypothetical protein
MHALSIDRQPSRHRMTWMSTRVRAFVEFISESLRRSTETGEAK